MNNAKLMLFGILITLLFIQSAYVINSATFLSSAEKEDAINLSAPDSIMLSNNYPARQTAVPIHVYAKANDEVKLDVARVPAGFYVFVFPDELKLDKGEIGVASLFVMLIDANAVKERSVVVNAISKNGDVASKTIEIDQEFGYPGRVFGPSYQYHTEPVMFDVPQGSKVKLIGSTSYLGSSLGEHRITRTLNVSLWDPLSWKDRLLPAWLEANVTPEIETVVTPETNRNPILDSPFEVTIEIDEKAPIATHLLLLSDRGNVYSLTSNRMLAINVTDLALVSKHPAEVILTGWNELTPTNGIIKASILIQNFYSVAENTRLYLRHSDDISIDSILMDGKLVEFHKDGRDEYFNRS